MGHIILWSVLIFGKNTNTVKRSTYCVLNATKKVNIEENAEKTSICSCLVTTMQGNIYTVNPC
jgi:hypothetical protein